jgi:Transposase/DDE superfamily endonuclease
MLYCARWTDARCCCGALFRDALRLRPGAPAMSASTKVSTAIDHCTTSAEAAQEHPLSRAAVLVLRVLHSLALVQEQCRDCGSWTKRRSDRTHRCDDCARRYQQQHHSGPSSAPAATVAPAASSLSDQDPNSHSHLAAVQRWMIVCLHKLRQDDTAIAQQVQCDIRTVRHWLQHYEQHHHVDDEARSGRKRKTTAEQDEEIEQEARDTKFTTPRRIKRKLGLDVSSRTIDRRLIEVGLFGRVAQHKKKFTEEEKRKRLSFAEGYKNWTPAQWMRVEFADEKLFLGEGFWGQVFVRRPKGEALNPEYCVDQDPHPVKVSAWACFSGHGLGYMYIFNENMDAKLLQGILGTHLIESAELHFDVEHAEQWWFLQDNAPQHKSVLVRTWLFNNGIQCIDFPPYSPDLNPIENLWADLARRVEQFQCETMEELQDIVAEEWKKTPKSLLRKLAHSMPKRCQAVIDAKGDHTKF